MRNARYRNSVAPQFAPNALLLLVLVLMDDLTVNEEKPFDALSAQNDDDSQPDPDEQLNSCSNQVMTEFGLSR